MGSHGIGLMESSTNLQGGDKGRKIITTRRRRRRRRALSTLNKNILQVPYAFKNKSLSSSSSSKRRSRNAVICNKADKKPHMMMMIQEEKKPETIIIDEFNEAMLMEEAEEEEEEDIVMEDSDLASDKEGVVDIDTCDEKNPLAVVEYIDDIYKFYKETERLSCVPPDYMEKQKDLTEKIRGILIDWLIKVHCSFGMMDETLYLTVNVIDRFFAVRQIVREEIQLVGVTALLLACKYENSSVPNRLFSFAERYYARRQVLDMEKLMANTLQFKFSLPTPYVFMKRFLKAAQSDKKLEDLSFLIMELCLVEYEMVKYTPSKLAASAIYTAQCTLNGYKEWSETCKFHTGYNEEDLIECARKMVGLHGKAGTGKLTGVHRKYNTTKFCYAARTEAALFLML